MHTHTHTHTHAHTHTHQAYDHTVISVSDNKSTLLAKDNNICHHLVPIGSCLFFGPHLLLHTDGTDVFFSLSLHSLALGHCDPHAVAMKPVLTNITADHEPDKYTSTHGV